MVPRTELLAALSDVKASQDEVQGKAKDLAWMEGQLAKAQEQFNKARQEAAQLRADMTLMVQRSDLDKAREQYAAQHAALAVESQKLLDSMAAMNSRISALETEKNELQTVIKVSFQQSYFLGTMLPFHLSLPDKNFVSRIFIFICNRGWCQDLSFCRQSQKARLAKKKFKPRIKTLLGCKSSSTERRSSWPLHVSKKLGCIRLCARWFPSPIWRLLRRTRWTLKKPPGPKFRGNAMPLRHSASARTLWKQKKQRV